MSTAARRSSLLEALKVYVVTDDAFLSSDRWFEKIEDVLQGGATAVQLRAKNITAGPLFEKGMAMRQLCRKYGAMFIVNDRVDLAIGLKADGVHVGQEDIPVTVARQLAGPQMIIGVSVKTVEQAQEALICGADYLGCGAAFTSGSKPSSRVVGPEGLRRVAEAVPLPVVAIGGITFENLSLLMPLYEARHIVGVAVISAILNAEQPDLAAKQFRSAFATARLDDPPGHSPSGP